MCVNRENIQVFPECNSLHYKHRLKKTQIGHKECFCLENRGDRTFHTCALHWHAKKSQQMRANLRACSKHRNGA